MVRCSGNSVSPIKAFKKYSAQYLDLEDQDNECQAFLNDWEIISVPFRH
jgi:hypothetical protein